MSPEAGAAPPAPPRLTAITFAIVALSVALYVVCTIVAAQMTSVPLRAAVYVIAVVGAGVLARTLAGRVVPTASEWRKTAAWRAAMFAVIVWQGILTAVSFVLGAGIFAVPTHVSATGGGGGVGIGCFFLATVPVFLAFGVIFTMRAAASWLDLYGSDKSVLGL